MRDAGRTRRAAQRQAASCGQAPRSAIQQPAVAAGGDSSRSQNSRAAPWPPRAAVTWWAMACTSACALGGAPRSAARAQQRQVGPVVAHRGDLRPVEAERRQQRLGGRQLVGGAVARVRDAERLEPPRSGGESRPVMTIGAMPAARSSFRPWPSSMVKRLNVSPCSLM